MEDELEGMNIRARLVGIIEGDPVHSEGNIELKDGATLKTFFKKADKQMGFKKLKYFRLSLKQGIMPSILINGDRLDMPEGMKHELRENDEVTVILPMSGG